MASDNERSAREIITQRELFVYWKITCNYALRDYKVWSGRATRIGKYVTNESLCAVSKKTKEFVN